MRQTMKRSDGLIEPLCVGLPQNESRAPCGSPARKSRSMPGDTATLEVEGASGPSFWARFKRRLFAANPFEGDIRPSPVPLLGLGMGRSTLPFPHPWNYREPLRILETYFWNSDAEQGPGKHNRYLKFPGFAPVLVTRDPALVRAITTET